jgi:hypothetical protein
MGTEVPVPPEPPLPVPPTPAIGAATVGDGLAEAAGVAIRACDARTVGFGVGLAAAFAGFATGLAVRFGVGFGVGLAVAFAVGFGVGRGVGRGVGLGVGFGVGLGVGLGVGVGVGTGVGVAGGLTVIDPPETSQVAAGAGWVPGWTRNVTLQVPMGTENVREKTAPVVSVPDVRNRRRLNGFGPLRKTRMKSGSSPAVSW